MEIEQELQRMGLFLPEEMELPEGVVLPFSFVHVRGNIAYISGHGPQNPDGSLADLFGKVGTDLTIEEAYFAAKLTALSILASLKREIGDLDRVTAWLRLFGMVNCQPDFTEHPTVINGCSDLIIELYGESVGAHARSAVGMTSLPFGLSVEIEGMVEIE